MLNFPNILPNFNKCFVLTLCFTFIASCGGGGGGGVVPGPISPPPSNSPPRFTSPTEFSFAENQPVSFVVSVSDPDGDTITITEDGTGDGGLFQLNATTGEVTALTANGTFNFEDPLDQDRNNVYVQSFVLNDGQSSVTQSISITITNVIEPPSYLGATDFAAGEGVIGFALSATDNDSSELSFALSGPDASAFIIENRDLTFVESPDFENPADADMNNVYEFVLSISNSDATIDVNLTATISNEDEPPFCESADTFSFAENTSGEIYRFVATDPEGDAISYENFTITAQNEIFDKLSFDPLTGAVTLSQGVDFEALTDPNGELSIAAGETICTVNFTVTDIEGQVTSGIKILDQASFVASIGDINEDGRDDLWITTQTEQAWHGKIIFSDFLTGAMPAATLDSQSASPKQVLPIFISSTLAVNEPSAELIARPVSDLDNDGINELLIAFSSCEACPQQREMAYLIWGDAIVNNELSEIVLDQLAADKVLKIPFRNQVSSILSFVSGDYDGDGRDDIAFGMPTPGEESFIIFGDYLADSKALGSLDFANATQDQVLDINIDYLSQPFTGQNMTSISDIDGDLYPELVFSSSQWVSVFYSSTIASARGSENVQLGPSFDLEINATSGLNSFNQKSFDLEGDGIPEIAWTLPAGGLASIAIGQTFSTTPNTKSIEDTATSLISTSISSITDLTNNGSDELVLAIRTSGDNSMYEVQIILGEAINAVSNGFFVDLATTEPRQSLPIRGFLNGMLTNQGLILTGFNDLDGDAHEELIISHTERSEIYVIRGVDIANALSSEQAELDINSLFNNEVNN